MTSAASRSRTSRTWPSRSPRTRGRERTTCFVYAVGWTQHTLGAQFIRTATILQLLLGNVGRPGSGIMALRGHASIQGSTDIPTLFNLLPGYLPMPKAGTHDTFDEYVEAVGSKKQKGFWANADAYTISLLKAWWGDAARADNDWAYDYLPRLTGPHGTYQTVMAMLEDEVEGYFLLGQNPAVGSAHGRMQRMGMSHLKWLVVRDLNMIESATFWKDGPEIASGELKTEDIETEVFFFPAAVPRREGRHRSPRRSDCCSGGIRPCSRPATARANCSSSSSWASASGSGWPGPPTSGTGRCWI